LVWTDAPGALPLLAKLPLLKPPRLTRLDFLADFLAFGLRIAGEVRRLALDFLDDAALLPLEALDFRRRMDLGGMFRRARLIHANLFLVPGGPTCRQGFISREALTIPEILHPIPSLALQERARLCCGPSTCLPLPG
jgi:hypothetical protein